MRFYDALQLDPGALKHRIRTAESPAERHKMQAAIVLRSFLIVAFAMVIIAPIASLFGAENNPVAVALFCILLSIRFVDFGYCIRDSLRNFGLVFVLLLTAPVLASLVHPILATLIHFGALFLILRMTCEQPEMGNGGLYGFAYVYLAGNPVVGELFWKRALLLLLGYVLCGAILYVKHRHKHDGVRFRDIAAAFTLADRKNRWQLRLALGVSLALGLGYLFHIERFMWAGFAASSLLSSYSDVNGVRERLSHRICGVVVGSLLFFVVYELLPPSLHSLLGPLGGVCLGFCTDYRFKTALNCFGALLLASGMYGSHGAVLLRIANNLVGVVFGFLIMLLFYALVDKRFEDSDEA